MPGPIHILTREALYERIWETPLATLGEEYSANGAWLKKLCLEAAIPLPPLGHWQRLRAGKPVTRKALPPRPPGASAIITIGHYIGWWRSPKEMLSDPPPLKPEFTEPVEAVVAHVLSGIEIPPLPTTPSATRRPPNANQRSVAILNALRTSLRNVGAQLCVSGIPPHELSVRSGETKLPFALSQTPEPLRLILQPKSKLEGVATIFLDSPDSPLEHRLPEIIMAIMTAIEMQYRAAAFRHYERCLERLADARKDAKERRAEAKRLREQRRIEQAEREKQRLFSQARDWRMAGDIRGFVAEILTQAENAAARKALAPWAAWALDQADLIDPVKQGSLLKLGLKR